jgi:hypothetical protein
MINVPLYNALVNVFKDVRIANEGESAVFSTPPKTATLNRLKTKYKDRNEYQPQCIHGGEQYHVCCPFCGDQKYRLYISHAWDKFLKDEGGTTIYAGKRAICHNERCLESRENYRKLDDTIRANIKEDDTKPIECSSNVTAFENRVINLPNCVPLLDPRVSSETKGYLEDRGYDVAELSDNWHVRAGTIPFYPKESIIFPIYQRGVLKGWQARYPGEDYKAIGKPKYFFPSGVKKSWMLYNMDTAKMYPCAVIVEGVLDAIRVGPMGIAMFGKIPSTHQEQLLSAYWQNGTILWIPDEDDPQSVTTANSYTDVWNSRELFKGGAHVLRLSKGDPGDHTRSDLWSMIVGAVPSMSRFTGGVIQSGSGTKQ